MPNTKDIVLGSAQKILFVGANGRGKTCAAATFPGPIKFYDFDGRMQPVKYMFPEKDIEYETYDARNYHVFAGEFNSLTDHCPWKTIVIDSVTSLSMTLILYQLRLRASGRKVSGGIDVTGWDEINGETVSISQILNTCLCLPCHVIFTAHPVARTQILDGKSVQSQTLVSYGNKINSILPGRFNEIYWFKFEPSIDTSKAAKRLVYTVGSEEEFAKTALPLPSVIDITNKSLYDIIQDAVKSHNISLEIGGGNESVKTTNKLVAF